MQATKLPVKLFYFRNIREKILNLLKNLRFAYEEFKIR